MAVEERLRNKILYKTLLYLLKILPMLVALVYLMNTVFSYYNIDTPLLSSIGGMSLLTIIFMYVASYVFQFCEYHRMFLHYIVIDDLINIYDWYIGIPIDNRELFVVHLALVGITLFIILYLYVKHHKKIAPSSSG